MVGTYTVMGHPGAGADRVIKESPYIDNKPDRIDPNDPATKKALEEQKARDKFIASNGKAVNFTKGADLLDQDRPEIQKDIDDYIDWQASIADPASGKKLNDPYVQAENNKKQQAIIDKIAKGQQHKKVYNHLMTDNAAHPNMYRQSEFNQGMSDWVNQGLGRGMMPTAGRKNDQDFLKDAKDYMPKALPVNRREDLPDGRQRIYKGTEYDQAAADKQIDQFLTQSIGKDMLQYAAEQAQIVNPNLFQLPPDVQGKIVRQTAHDIIDQHWKAKTGANVESYDSAPKADSVLPQYGLDEADKAGVISHDVPVAIELNTHTVDPQTGTVTSTPTKGEIVMNSYQSIPVTAKTKISVAKNSEILDAKTLLPVKGAGTLNVVPSGYGTTKIHGKWVAVILGSSNENKQLGPDEVVSYNQDADGKVTSYTLSGEPGKVYKVTNNVIMPMRMGESNLRNARLQVKWPQQDADKRNALNGTAAPAKKQIKGKIKPSGNLNF